MLDDVRRRVLVKLRLTKRGHEVPGNTTEAQMEEEPRRGFVHGDVDVLFTRNQLLRWVIIDELPMTPDTRLGLFETNLTDAAVQSISLEAC